MARGAGDFFMLVSNPLGWVHGQLAGGWKRAWTVGGVYLFGGALLLMIIYRATGVAGGVNVWQFAQGVMWLLIAIQAGVMLLVGSSGVRKAVQRDVTTGMLESHRLTPINGLQAVVGYMTGPNITLLPVCLANWLIAVVVGIVAGRGDAALTWSLGFVVLACPTLFMWSWTVLTGLCIRKATPVIPILIVLSMTGGLPVMSILPGLGMFVGAFPAMTQLQRAAGGVLTLDWTMLIPLVGQVLMSLLAIAGAARRYLRDDVQAFSWPWGLAITAFAAGWGGLGLRLYSEFRKVSGGPFNIDLAPASVQWVATLTALSMIACLPALAAGQMQARWSRRAAAEPRPLSGAPISYFWAALMASVIGAVLLAWAAGAADSAILDRPGGWIAMRLDGLGRPRFRLLLLAFMGMLLAILPIAGLARMWYGRSERAIAIVMVWFLITWVGPVFLDAARTVYFVERTSAENWSWITGVSPPGLWALAVHRDQTPLAPGLIVQIVAALLLGIVLPALLTRRTSPPVARPIEPQGA